MKWVAVENENDLWPEDVVVMNVLDKCLYQLAGDDGDVIKKERP